VPKHEPQTALGLKLRVPTHIFKREQGCGGAKMPFQVRARSLIVITKSAKDEVRLLDKLITARIGSQTEMCDMNGRAVKIDELRREAGRERPLRQSAGRSEE
jgi:hypothetical protein